MVSLSPAATANDRRAERHELAVAFEAARSRAGLVALLLVLAARGLVADRQADGRDGRRTRD